MTSSPALSRRGAWALALTATLTMAVSYVDRQTLAVLAPTVTKALDISEQGYGWLVSAFSLAYLVGTPIAGRVVDRLGARRGLLAAVVVWTCVAALHAVVPGFGALFALRIALGLAESPSFPGAAQTVHRALPPEDRARGFGVLFTGSSIGAMIAPPLAAGVASRFGFRAAFLVTAIAGLAWVPLWLAIAWSPRGRATLDGERPAAPTPAAAPIAPLDLARHPAVLRAVCAIVASSPVIAFVLNWSAKLLAHDHGVAQADVGRYLWLPPLLFDAGAFAFGHAASRRAAARPRGAPDRLLVAIACALGLAVIATPSAASAWAATVALAVAMAGGGALFALVTADVLSRVPPGSVSATGGLTAAAQSLAYIVATPLVGAAIQRTDSYGGVLLALGVWLVPGTIAWLLWPPPPAWSDAPAGSPQPSG
jgi:ACS family hexuronate transporter-like MFS transporter